MTQLIAGAIGGNAAGAGLKNLSPGTLGNSLAGVVGGGISGQLLGILGGAGMGDAAGMGSGLDISAIVQSLAGGGVGGAVAMTVVGMNKKAMTK